MGSASAPPVVFHLEEEFDGEIFHADVPYSVLKAAVHRALYREETLRVTWKSKDKQRELPFVLQIDTDSSDSKELAAKFVRDRLSKKGLWGAFLEYNRTFIAGQIFGSFYHAGPVIPDASLSLLQKINEKIFTRDGQGRACASLQQVPEFVSAIVSIAPTFPVRIQQVQTSHVNPNSIFLYQKAYLHGVVMMTPDGIDTIKKLATLTSHPDLFVAAWDKKGRVLFATAGFPEMTPMTAEMSRRVNPASITNDDAMTHGGLRFDSEYRRDFFENIVKRFNPTLHVPEYVNVIFQERQFCQTGKDLLSIISETIG